MHRKRIPKGDIRKEGILRDVTQLIVRDGYRGQSLREIGEAIATAPAHILYYFSSREVLLQNALELWDADAIRPLENEASAGTLDEFVAAVKRSCKAIGMTELFLSLAAEAIDPAHVAHSFFKKRVIWVRERLGQAIRHEQRQGTIAPTLDPDFTARQLIALADGLQLQALLADEPDAFEDFERSISVLRSFAGGSSDGEAEPIARRGPPAAGQ